ncbi:MAG TPA: GtrA family protein [Gammaproteobacteria bacterium]
MYGQFLRFALAGCIGFVVDVAVLYAALWAGLGYYAGRACSFLVAVAVTWQLNRRYTFSATRTLRLHSEWFRYLTAMLGGGAVNYACYTVIVASFPKTGLLPAVAVAAGSIAGLMVNFLTSKFWVFRPPGG